MVRIVKGYYRDQRLPARLLRLMVGLAVVAWGTQCMLAASLGLNPHGILVQGVIAQTGLSYGTASQILGGLLVLVSVCFRRYPGIGTVLNAIVIGALVDLYAVLPIWNVPDSMIIRLVLFFMGLFFFSFGLALYLSEELGAGPRDGIMMLLVQAVFRGSVWKARTLLDLVSAAVGIAMGAPVGIGSVLAVALSGVTLQLCFRLLPKDPKAFRQENILQTLAALRNKPAP